MKIPEIIAPVNTLEDMHFVKETKCKNVYAFHSNFYKKIGQEKLVEFIKTSKEQNLKFYINFKPDIKEAEIKKLTDLFEFMTPLDVEGIFINDFAVLEIIKNIRFPKKIIIDSGLNIHNLAGTEFIFSVCKPEMINVTEEIYIKNLVKIRKYTDCKLATDSDNLPWTAKEIIENEAVDAIIIKAKFNNSDELIKGINSVEKILEAPDEHKNQKLPFKNTGNTLYKTDHFSGEFQNSKGRTFKFSGNIRQHRWEYRDFFGRQRKKITPGYPLPVLNLRLTGLDRVKELKKYLKKLKNNSVNPVNAIEYGEIINTADLAKNSFTTIIDKVKNDCAEYGIKFKLGTPKILTERDFDRVYEYTKAAITRVPHIDSVVVNNAGFLHCLIKDKSIDIPIETGYGLNIKNSASIELLCEYGNVRTVDFSNFEDIENIKQCIEKIGHKIPKRQITIAGSSRIPSSGLCPLNKDSAILSRLSCSAPCHKGIYSVRDKPAKKSFHIVADGFCRMHMFKDKILDLYKHINLFQETGINEFIVDFGSLPAKLVPVMLNKYFDSLNNPQYKINPDFLTDEYGIEKYLLKNNL